MGTKYNAKAKQNQKSKAYDSHANMVIAAQ